MADAPVTTLRVSDLRPLLWALSGLALLFTVALVAVVFWPQPLREVPAAAVQPLPCQPHTPCLAVVIDDIGRDMAPLSALLALDLDFTFAVLPHAAHTAASIAAIAARGREYLLHLPLEPEDLSRVSDEAVILEAGRPLAPLLAECLQRVPGAVGINNHMGSLFSRLPRELEALMTLVAQRGLWFLDSKTIAASQICVVARQTGVPCLERDLFLDDANDTARIAERIEEAVALARRRGWAIAVAHPRPGTVTALRQRLAAGGDSLRVRRLSALYDGTRY